PPFGRAQVVPPVYLVDVRAFGPDRLFLGADPAVDKDLARADELARGKVEFLDPDRAVTFVARLAFGRAVVDEPAATVVVDEQRGVDAVKPEPDRVGPRTGRVGCGDVEIVSATDAGVENVELPRVEGNRRGIDAL